MPGLLRVGRRLVAIPTAKRFGRSARWEAEGRCRDCAAPGPHRKREGTLSKSCKRCRKRYGRAPGGIGVRIPVQSDQ